MFAGLYTERGRLNLPRKRIAIVIAESFWEASQIISFAKRIEIVIRATDAAAYAINLRVLANQIKSALDLSR